MREPHEVFALWIWNLGARYHSLWKAFYCKLRILLGDGANDPAINSSVRVNPATSDGIVMLVSGHPTLASDIGS